MRPWKWAVLLIAVFVIVSFGFDLKRAWSREIVRVPTARTEVAASSGLRTAVFAGGCFWGLEAVFEQLKGVTDVVSGYAGGTAKGATYDIVSGGGTQHAEAVQITYDPAQISYGRLLEVFFAVAHDPTQLNRQGPDRGYQYRSAIFYSSEDQRLATEEYVKTLSDSRVFRSPVVTKVVPLPEFYPAEEYHQDYLRRHQYDPYIVVNDAPKVARLREQFPQLVK